MTLKKEVSDFILWLTPCGEVNPGPTLEIIGREARRLNKKIGERGGVADYCGGCENVKCKSALCVAMRRFK